LRGHYTAQSDALAHGVSLSDRLRIRGRVNVPAILIIASENYQSGSGRKVIHAQA
jgi:hypothetical protein